MNCRQPELIIFDFDGTLADTLADIAGAVNSILASYGLPVFEIDRYRLMVGNGFSALVAAVLPHERARDQVFKDEFQRLALQEYERRCLDRTKPYPGMREALSTLAGRGIRLAILSNKPDHLLKYMAAALFPDIPFVAVWGNANSRPRKPDPAAALEICRQNDIAPERTALVGDSGVDMQTARAAGMIPVGVLYGYRDRQELAGAGAEFLVQTPLEIPALFGIG